MKYNLIYILINDLNIPFMQSISLWLVNLLQSVNFQENIVNN